MTDSVVIKMTNHGLGRVWVNGEEVSAQAVSFQTSVNGLNTVELSLLAARVEIEGPAAVIERKPRDADRTR